MIFSPHRRKRLEFNGPTRRDALARSLGVCECHLIPGMKHCGVRLSAGNVYYEHIIPDHLNGGNDLSNCAVLTKTCWKIKTATTDLPMIAKAKRGFDRHWNTKNPPQQPLPGGKHDDRYRKLSGEVVFRVTGKRA